MERETLALLLYGAAVVWWAVPLTTYLGLRGRNLAAKAPELKDQRTQWYRRARILLIVATVYVVLGSAWDLYWFGTLTAYDVALYVCAWSAVASFYVTLRVLVHFFDEAPMGASYRKM